MTKEAALFQFFNSFGIPAYVDTNVVNENGEEDVTFPYITYSAPSTSFDNGPVSITANIWYYGEQEAPINAKAREIAERIGMGGIHIPCDGGNIYLSMGTPFIQPLRDEVDPKIKRRYLNIDRQDNTTY